MMRQTSTQVPSLGPVPVKPSELELAELACKQAVDEFDLRSEQLLRLLESNREAIIRLKAQLGG